MFAAPAEHIEYRHIRVTPLAGVLGARIDGVDLANVDAQAVSEIRRAFARHGVIAFPDQRITPAEQIAFTAHFGPVKQHPLYRSAVMDDHPEILVIEHKAGQWINGRNDMWHSDVTFAEAPPLGSVLHCKAAVTGLGDTLFCSMAAAYEVLSPGLRRLLDPLRAEHSSERMVAINNSRSYNVPIEEIPPPALHPVVRTHPDTGRRALFVNPIYTTRLAGMSEAESGPILDYLYALAVKPERVYRHRWRVGDVVMFDNRCTMHYVAVDYGPEVHRLMHRTTAGGHRPR